MVPSDFLDLFRQPQLWSSARPKISVLKLGPQQVDGRRRATKNSFDELSTVGAFRMLRSWDIRLAIEAPAIKKWDCSGKRASRYTLEMIRNVEGAGGKVDLLSLDEPLSAALRACDDTLEGAANKTADYRRAMAWITKVHIAIGAPDDAVFQSRVLRSSPRCAEVDPKCTTSILVCGPQDPPGCGDHSVPVNIPEGNQAIFSHVRLINDGVKTLLDGP